MYSREPSYVRIGWAKKLAAWFGLILAFVLLVCGVAAAVMVFRSVNGWPGGQTAGGGAPEGHANNQQLDAETLKSIQQQIKELQRDVGQVASDVQMLKPIVEDVQMLKPIVEKVTEQIGSSARKLEDLEAAYAAIKNLDGRLNEMHPELKKLENIETTTRSILEQLHRLKEPPPVSDKPSPVSDKRHLLVIWFVHTDLAPESRFHSIWSELHKDFEKDLYLVCFAQETEIVETVFDSRAPEKFPALATRATLAAPRISWDKVIPTLETLTKDFAENNKDDWSGKVLLVIISPGDDLGLERMTNTEQWNELEKLLNAFAVACVRRSDSHARGWKFDVSSERPIRFLVGLISGEPEESRNNLKDLVVNLLRMLSADALVAESKS